MPKQSATSKPRSKKIYVEEYRPESTLFYMACKDHAELDEMAEFIGCDNLHSGDMYHCYLLDAKQREAAADFGALEVDAATIQSKIAQPKKRKE